jgi:manganese transport protein
MNSVVLDGVIPGPRLGELEAAASGSSVQAPVPLRVTRPLSVLRRILSFAGPGYMVAVGYMDPGNWATSLSAGSGFGYSLLSVILLSNMIAMLLQAAAVRLGLASGLDLAQSCRQYFSPRINLALWLLCEIAIVACNMAEVLGMACGLGMLFHIPLTLGVCITALDVMLILRLQQRGVRYLEIFIIALVGMIGACLAAQMWWLHPPLAAMAQGFVPTTQIVMQPGMLYLAVGIIGATVMPHNLYLHSSIVKTRRHDQSEGGIRQAISYATLDSNFALGLALFVNIAILVLAAGAFHRPGQPPISELQDAYRLLSPLLGTTAAGTVFGIGLIASGLSSSITGTLAGQVVMEGFLDIRMSRGRRALLTRILALIPAVAVTIWFGHAGVGRLLVLSQVILGLQLPFAVIPLLWFTTRSKHLGVHAFRPVTASILWAIALGLIAINGWGLYVIV